MIYRVTYTETFTGTKIIEANSEIEAMDKLSDMIDVKEVVPTNDFDGHETSIEYAEVIK